MPKMFEAIMGGNIVAGIGIALGGLILAPIVTKIAKPAAVKGAQGVLMVTDKAAELMESSKKHLEGFIDEAKKIQEHARDTRKEAMAMVGMGDVGSVIEGMKEEKNMTDQLIKELSAQVAELRNEIHTLRPIT